MIKKLLVDGFDTIQQELDQKEKSKVGFLRGGSTGCVVNGAYLGECPRIAQRRLHGLTHPISFESDLVFNLGFSHENNVLSKLLINDGVKAVTIPEGQYSFDTAHTKLTIGNPIQTDISGYKWSGSPDFVVEMLDGSRFGIETKALASSSSASKIYHNDFPYTKAILQAAMYSYVTGLPWYILYGLYFYAGSYRDKVSPFLKEFKIELEGTDNTIVVVREGGERVITDFSIKGILDFYRQVAESREALPRPTEKEMGPTYNRCDYCWMREACQDYDLGITTSDELVGGLNESVED